MKNNSLILVMMGLLFSVGIQPSNAQSSTKEIGIIFSGLNNFDFVYKNAKSENKLFRFSAGFADINYAKQDELSNLNLTLGTTMGIEKRKDLNEKFKFIHGPEFSFSYAMTRNKNNSSSNYSMQFLPGIGYMVGCLYELSDHFNINIESTPSIGARFTAATEEKIAFNNLSLSANTNLVSIGLVYKLKK